MKKCYLYLLCTVLLLNCVGCGPKFAGYNAAKWDGSIASGYAGGDGTETNPYQISSPEQLAYLAQEVNGGNEYREKFFTLEADIDLNNLEWTPIGNGEHSFAGTFDGKGYTLTNLKLSKIHQYSKVIAHSTANRGLIGMFGYCQDAVLKNINISNATTTLDNIDQYDQLYAGILVGNLTTTAKSEISNIKLSNSSISTSAPTKIIDNLGSNSLYIGGIIGHVSIEKDAHFYKMEKIQSDLFISNNLNHQFSNYVGCIVGYISNRSLFECTNFAGYLTTKLATESRHFVGSFGCISNIEGKIKLSNSFSVIDTNIPPSINANLNVDFNAHLVNAIIGQTGYTRDMEGNVKGSYEFKNLFGYVKSGTEGINTYTTLYELSQYIVYTEENCQGCTALPDGHNLPTDIWDTKDLSKPVLIPNQ